MKKPKQLATKRRRAPSLSDLTKGARGIMNSGIPDLATNPQHLAGFGRDQRRSKTRRARQK
jgi:hypothetical protein